MKNKEINEQGPAAASMSNIIFGTSSDAIQEGLHNRQLEDPGNARDQPTWDDKNQIVNEEEQNEIVNPSEEGFYEGDDSFDIDQKESSTQPDRKEETVRAES